MAAILIAEFRNLPGEGFGCYASLLKEIHSTSCAFAGAPLHSAQYDIAFIGSS